MTETERALLEAIALAEYHDLVPTMIYADWLADQEDPAQRLRGEYIQAEMALVRKRRELWPLESILNTPEVELAAQRRQEQEALWRYRDRFRGDWGPSPLPSEDSSEANLNGLQGRAAMLRGQWHAKLEYVEPPFDLSPRLGEEWSSFHDRLKEWLAHGCTGFCLHVGVPVLAVVRLRAFDLAYLQRTLPPALLGSCQYLYLTSGVLRRAISKPDLLTLLNYLRSACPGVREVLATHLRSTTAVRLPEHPLADKVIWEVLSDGYNQVRYLTGHVANDARWVSPLQDDRASLAYAKWVAWEVTRPAEAVLNKKDHNV